MKWHLFFAMCFVHCMDKNKCTRLNLQLSPSWWSLKAGSHFRKKRGNRTPVVCVCDTKVTWGKWKPVGSKAWWVKHGRRCRLACHWKIWWNCRNLHFNQVHERSVIDEEVQEKETSPPFGSKKDSSLHSRQFAEAAHAARVSLDLVNNDAMKSVVFRVSVAEKLLSISCSRTFDLGW